MAWHGMAYWALRPNTNGIMTPFMAVYVQLDTTSRG